MPGPFHKELPPLEDAITVPKFALELLGENERSDPKRVATRLTLNTGDISKAHQAESTWEIDGGKHGGKVQGQRFFAGATLVIKRASSPFEIKVTDFTGQPDEPIRLDKKHKEVFFFNFDTGVPSIDELTKPDHDDPDFGIDHDFKWVYHLLNRVDPTMNSWIKWLDTEPFPAPVRVFSGNPEMDLIPVSTCFETVWSEK